MKKKSWWFVASAVLVSIALMVFWTRRKPELKWRTAPVERGPIQISVTSTGTLQAVVTIQVGTQVSGTIAALYADFNSKVKKGQVIARLDSTLLKAALQDARSSMSRVHAQFRQASEELKRSKALFERSLVSQSELDQASANAQVAEANLNSVAAQVERAQINLRYTVIQSPIDGIVLSRAVDVGQTVAASFNTPTLFTLAGDLREMRVQAAVDEADIGKVRAGQKAEFTVDAYPDTVFTGEVEQVRLQPKTEQNVVTYDVIVRAPNPNLRLMPGMTANLTIAILRREDVLLVPSAALRFRPPGQKSFPRDSSQMQHSGGGHGLGEEHAQGGQDRPRKKSGSGDSGNLFILVDGKPDFVKVKVGLSDGGKTEIEGEVQPGTPVLVGVDSTEGQTSGGTPFGMPTGGPRKRM